MITENRSNYYDILEVSPSATQHDILLAYQKAKKTYSIENKALLQTFTTGELAALNHLIEEAYSVLCNQNYRSLYEQRMNTKSYSESDVSLNGIKETVDNAAKKANALEQLTQRYNQLQSKSEESSDKFEVDQQFEQEIQNCTEWTGSFLKKIREYKKISIEKLHEATKVNPWYLEALEAMDSRNLPAAVFVRGYVIQVAKHLELEDKVVVESYMKLYKKKLESEK